MRDGMFVQWRINTHIEESLFAAPQRAILTLSYIDTVESDYHGILAHLTLSLFSFEIL